MGQGEVAIVGQLRNGLARPRDGVEVQGGEQHAWLVMVKFCDDLAPRCHDGGATPGATAILVLAGLGRGRGGR